MKEQGASDAKTTAVADEVQMFGLAIGAAMGALAGHFANYGIDDNITLSPPAPSLR